MQYGHFKIQPLLIKIIISLTKMNQIIFIFRNKKDAFYFGTVKIADNIFTVPTVAKLKYQKILGNLKKIIENSRKSYEILENIKKSYQILGNRRNPRNKKRRCCVGGDMIILKSNLF